MRTRTLHPGLLVTTLALLSVVSCAGESAPRSSQTLESPDRSAAPSQRRPVSTYSIVARDGETGRFGVAVQSHWFSVGSIVPWAEPGVGAVATQSLADVSYGQLGLDLMRGGKSAADALAALTSTDSGAAYRQVAMIDADGGVAVHTGELCIAHAGHRTGRLDDGTVYSVQANLMARRTTPAAMASAFESAEGDFADRLLAALRAAEREGGDIRGRQSSSMLITAPSPTGNASSDRLVDLRIEDHPEPIEELGRLLRLHRAYQHMNAGDHAMERDDPEAALREYAAAKELAPEIAEMSFWTGVSLVNAGMVDEAIPYFITAFKDPSADWRETLRRLPASRLLPDDPDLLSRLLDAGASNSTNR